MEYIISGIQQIGVGVSNADEAWQWYAKHFGVDVPIFTEKAEAKLMLPYTGGQPRSRYAILALNLNGGGGFEVWQYEGRTPLPPSFKLQVGDLGIFAAKIKCRDITATFDYFKKNNLDIRSSILQNPDGNSSFYVADPYGNIFELVTSKNWFQQKKNYLTGGIYGATIGVSDMEKSIAFYRDMLGYDQIVYDQTGSFEGYTALGAKGKFRKVLLTHSQERVGAFSKMLGASQVELVQSLDRTPRKIFEDRYWGDLGFIHLCFDIRNMNAIKEQARRLQSPFTVDSGDNSFDMGEAAGRFAYNEDPDGTLIEYVETHKIPILKSVGWYLSLMKRPPQKSLPTFMLKALGLNRKKF